MSCSAGTVLAIIASFLLFDLTRALTLKVTYTKTPLFLDIGAIFNFEVEIGDFNNYNLDLNIKKVDTRYVRLKWFSPVSKMSPPEESDRNQRWDIGNLQNDKRVKKLAISIRSLTAFDGGNYSLLVQQVNAANMNRMENESDFIELQLAGVLVIISVLQLYANFSQYLSH